MVPGNPEAESLRSAENGWNGSSLTYSLRLSVCLFWYLFNVKLDVDCWLLFFVVFPFFLLWATNLRLIKSNFTFTTLDLFYINLCCWVYERAVESTTFAATLENLAVLSVRSFDIKNLMVIQSLLSSGFACLTANNNKRPSRSSTVKFKSRHLCSMFFSALASSLPLCYCVSSKSVKGLGCYTKKVCNHVH